MYVTHQRGKPLKHHGFHFLLDFSPRIGDKRYVCSCCIDGTQWNAIRTRRKRRLAIRMSVCLLWIVLVGSVEQCTCFPSNTQPLHTKRAPRTQFCDTQRSLGNRSLFIFLVIPSRPVRTNARTFLPTAARAFVPTQLAHLHLESLHNDSEPRRPTKCIVGLLYALKTSDICL